MRLPTALLAASLAAIQPSNAGLLKRLFVGSDPKVTIDYGTFKGVSDFRTGTDNFLGVPFAKAGRLENPRLLSRADKLPGVQDATKYGDACPQVELIASPLNNENAEIGGLLAAVELLAFKNISQQSEDCLNLNVQVPKGTKPGDKLPVVQWIHGGGFELGSSAALGSEQTALPGIIYQGANLVKRSLEMKQPVIFVSANYRLNAFGTMSSQEITDAGVSNLGLKDQRAAMRWIQKHIHTFGGDPSKVTIWGESAGAMSIGTHLVLNGGDNEGLFRGAVMFSGAASKFLDYRRGQPTFDLLTSKVGCGAAAGAAKLACFRAAPYSAVYKALQEIPNFFSYYSTLVPWYPRPDGGYLPESPDALVRKGAVSRVPYIIGDMRDEGTLFSLVNQLNITTDADFRAYYRSVFFPRASRATVDALAALYPADPAAGSPFGTGAKNAIGPQYKRLAALTGDYTFQAPRRQLLRHTEGRQPMWTYELWDSLPLLGRSGLLDGLDVADLPVLGSFHVSDVTLYAFGTIPKRISRNTLNVMSTLIAFVNHLDPNKHGLKDLPHWPQWNSEKKPMFRYAENGCKIIKDDYREAAMDFINDHPEELSY